MKKLVYVLAALATSTILAPSIASAEDMKSDMKEGGMTHHRMHNEKRVHHEMPMHHHHMMKKEMKKEM